MLHLQARTVHSQAFFHPLSGKIPLDKLSHHCSVLSEFLRIISTPTTTVNSSSNASKSCNSSIVLLRQPEQLTAFGNKNNKKPQHWKLAARAASERKRALTTKMRRLPAILSVYSLSDHAIISRNFRLEMIARLHVNAGYFSTTARTITSIPYLLSVNSPFVVCTRHEPRRCACDEPKEKSSREDVTLF